ncbi:hypothetical protein [Thalassobellus citreus]|uniref:hypothetical protein n=1 Tax=Thalassobellus citreus TaxID=3367752 RepID=UPI00379CB8BF
MEKLTKEDIQFIDTYLKNSDIIFTDIRIEMVDHIASEIENVINNGDSRDFYYLFKDYMIANKRKLLNDRKKYFKASDKKIFRILLKKFFSFQGMIIFCLTLFSFNLINEFTDNNKSMFHFVKYTPFVLLIIIGMIYFLFIKKKEERYSSVERITFYFVVIGQLINILANPSFIKIELVTSLDLTWLKIGASIFVLVLILLLKISFELKNEYVLKYKKVL